MTNIRTSSIPGDRREAYHLLNDLIQSMSVALITTVDANGIMQTRQLPNTNVNFNGTLWFLASAATPFVQELREHPDVLVTYADHGRSRFVVVNGSAEIRNDPGRARKLWHPLLASWLPGGADDPSLALIQVEVEDVDVWE